MNKKDCESIGYILADSNAPEHIVDRFTKLDPRIQEEYAGFCEVQYKYEAVMDRYEELMTQKLGKNWPLMKDKSGHKEMYEQAVMDVYGEEYHPSLLKR